MGEVEAEQPRRRFKLATWQVMCLWLMSPVVLFLLWRVILFVAVERAIERVREEGYPTNCRELNAYYKTPKSDANAAVLYEKASELIEPDVTGFWDDSLDEAWAPVPEEWMVRAKHVFEKHREAQELIKAAAERTEARYNVKFKTPKFDSTTDSFGDNEDFRVSHSGFLICGGAGFHVSTFIRCRADYAAISGEAERAIDWNRIGWRHFESLASAPTPNALGERQLEGNDLFMMSQLILNRCPMTDKQLIKLDAILQSIHTQVDSDRIIAGCRAELIEKFKIHHDPAVPPVWRHDAWQRFELPRLLGAQQLDQLKALALTREISRIARLEGKAREEGLKHWKDELSTLPECYTLTLGLWEEEICGEVGQHFELLEAQISCLRAAIGVERYRLVHNGETPQRLEQLVPRFLSSVPIDPFSHEPIQIKTIDGGYQVFHPGWEGVWVWIHRRADDAATTQVSMN